MLLQRYITESTYSIVWLLLLLLLPFLPFLTSPYHIPFSSSGQHNLILLSPQQADVLLNCSFLHTNLEPLEIFDLELILDFTSSLFNSASFNHLTILCLKLNTFSSNSSYHSLSAACSWSASKPWYLSSADINNLMVSLNWWISSLIAVLLTYE